MLPWTATVPPQEFLIGGEAAKGKMALFSKDFFGAHLVSPPPLNLPLSGFRDVHRGSSRGGGGMVPPQRAHNIVG